MIFSETSAQPATSASTDVVKPIEPVAEKPVQRKAMRLHYMAVVCLLAACFGANWFAYQFLLVPQPQSFAPDWHGAQWMAARESVQGGEIGATGAVDSTAATAFFRYETALQTVPDNEFVTITANQVFQLYINGVLVGANNTDMGNFPRAYMYEVTASMTVGVNVFAVRVSNMNNQTPLLRLSIGTVTGGVISYVGTDSGSGWLATTQSTLVFPSYSIALKSSMAWTSPSFDASAWRQALQAPTPAISPSFTVNPILYERPISISTNWVSAGIGSDGYFVRQLSVPAGTTHVWLRVAATGTSSIFLNGNRLITWNYQPSTIRYNGSNGGKNAWKRRRVLALGVYDASPYLHAGMNTIALHMTLPTINGVSNGSTYSIDQLLMDMLMSDAQGHASWFTESDGWHASHQVVPDWASGSTATQAWAAPVTTGAPSGLGLVYASKSSLISKGQRGTQIVPISLQYEVLALSMGLVLGLWLLVSLVVMRRYYRSRRAALEVMSLAYLPALAFEGLLVVLAKEPQMPQPFPYTLFWGFVLLLLVAAGYLLLLLHARTQQQRTMASIASPLPSWARASIPLPIVRAEVFLRETKKHLPVKVAVFLCWLRLHWPIIVIVALAAPLVWYGLGYEPYWQDEMTSYLVAKSIMAHGLPLLPSGFVYPKGELYSYVLALSMKIFGDQNGAPRIVSAIEYTVTIPLLYRVGCYFFDRRIALLAAATMAFSPQEIAWGHQIRMYQQAQMLTLLAVFVFYKAVQERQRIRSIYVAMVVLIIMYLSHEETFIILPALVSCVLFASWKLRDRKHHLPEVFYQKHWWYAAVLGVCVIGAQLLIVHVTHPPVLGTDTTSRPEVQLTTDNISYYFNLLFFPTANQPWLSGTFISGVASTIELNSILAVVGCLLVRRSGNLRITYCALFLVLGSLAMVFLFTMQADRYFYPLIPFYYLMGAYALVTIMRACWRFACSHAVQPRPFFSERKQVSLPLRLLMGLMAAFVFLSLLVIPILPLNSYNVFVSRVAGLSYYHHFGDSQDVQQYMQGQLQKDDVVISIIPDTIVLYYVGRSDYFFSVNHALFLFEKNGHIVDTYSGQIALLHESDLEAVLAKHGRIWIISGNNSYQRNVLKRFTIPSDFHIVFEGTESIVYLRGG